MATYSYKGFEGAWAFDYGTKRFHGEIQLKHGVISFTGSSPEDVLKQMERAIDNYLRSCEAGGVAPGHSPKVSNRDS